MVGWTNRLTSYFPIKSNQPFNSAFLPSFVQDASTFLPYNGDVKVEDAFKVIEEYQEKVTAVRATQVNLEPGTLDSFIDSKENVIAGDNVSLHVRSAEEICQRTGGIRRTRVNTLEPLLQRWDIPRI